MAKSCCVRVTLLVAVLTLLAGQAAAASGPATLYFHVADSANLDNIPLNTLAPPANFTFRAGGGPTAATFTCASAAGGPGVESQTVHAIAYAAATDDAVLPQALRSEWRGLAYATRAGGNMTLHWYVETSSQAGGPGGQDPDQVPLAVPNVVVKATVREGEDTGAGVEGYDQGLLIAEGASDPALLAGPQTQGAGVDMVDGHYVYNITVTLAVKSDKLGEKGFNVRVQAFADNPLCTTTGGNAMAPVLRIHNSAGHRPSLGLTVDEPIKVMESSVAESQAGVVHLRATVLPVWGAYAFADARVAATGPGPVGNATTQTLLPDAGGAVRPSSPAYYFWNWDAGAERATAGHYALNLTVSDRDGNTAQAGGLSFTLAESETHPPAPATKGSPSPVAPLSAVMLLLAALAVRCGQWKRA